MAFGVVGGASRDQRQLLSWNMAVSCTSESRLSWMEVGID